MSTATVQPERIREGLRSTGLKHGQEDVPVEVGNVQVTRSFFSASVAFCATGGTWRRTGIPAVKGDDQPLPGGVRVVYDCGIPQSGSYGIRGLASANGELVLRVYKFVPMS